MANESIKVFQKGAFQLEAGQTGAGQSPGWGESGSVETLGANDAYPYLSLGKSVTINKADDNSITGEAFKEIPRKVTEYIENNIEYHARFAGLNSKNFWMWGFENSIVEVVAFIVNTVSVDPTAGDTYDDTDGNGFTFMRKETWRTQTLYIFRADDSVAPTLQTGDLDRVSGSGDDPITFTSHSTLMYEHLYELDAHERHFVDYRTNEQITGWASGDKKNRMATLGVAMGLNDYRYPNAMCKGFNFRSSAGELATINNDFAAYEEERGDYSSSSWTFPTTRNSSDNIVAHHQLRAEIGVDEDNLVALGVTSVEIGVGIPLQILQDTLSGQKLAEPVLEGKYDATLSMVLSRHSVDTYQGYRDAWTDTVARVSADYGFYMQEYLFQLARIPEAGPDDADVATEPLKLELGYETANNWSGWLYGNTLLQDSVSGKYGGLVFRTRDFDSTNHMFEI